MRSAARAWTKRVVRWLAALALACALPVAAQPVVVVDDGGRVVRLPRPAARIVSLAPHITETLFEAGAGDLVVGTVRYSDYPEAAKKIPRIGDHAMLDLERIVALKPDLIIAWFHGNSERQLAKVRALGIPVFESRPKSLAGISSSLLRMGELTGREKSARRAASRYAARLEALRAEYAARSPVRVFYQVWRKPLLTINGDQIISDAIRVCGGRNIFADASLLVTAVDLEAVAAANPDAIVASGTGEEDDLFDDWRRLPDLRATADHGLILLRTETLGRPSPRILEGTAMLCRQLDAVRARRESAAPADNAS